MNKNKKSKTLSQAQLELREAGDKLVKAVLEAIVHDLAWIRDLFSGLSVKTIRGFESERVFGEVNFFPYQIAFGISVRYLSCKDMGWMVRIYFGPFKVWFNWKPRRRK